VQWLLEFPFLGIPGIVRFIDVRTQWFDDSVNAAIRDGIKQVGVTHMLRGLKGGVGVVPAAACGASATAVAAGSSSQGAAVPQLPVAAVAAA
jgi:hypothetical protein